MRELMEKRVEALREELRSGQEMLASLDAKRGDLQQTLLRISGAVQVLEEMLDDPAAGSDETSAGRDRAGRPDQ
ncbi:hypothetical protein GCM10022226_36790 [Sphaerisporangium flaviroseum]|uniref:Uncharacterized protein n=1 Tax=Sphaerisporangium flaviroseum TaxID=509199 RepID=A0ABP7I985_9ACTN